jgi:hypothetical protein
MLHYDFKACPSPLYFMTNTKYSEFNSGTMDATSGGGTANTSGTLGFSPVFSWVRIAQCLILFVVLCRQLFFFLIFSFWPCVVYS